MNNLYNLQLFADGGEGDGQGQGAAGQAGQDAGTGAQGGATYDQAEAERIATARAERAVSSALTSWFTQQGMDANQAAQALQNYKQSHGSTAAADAIRERDEAREQLAGYQRAQSVRDAGVREDDVDYVVFKAASLAAEKGTKFDAALATWLAENPKYANANGGSTYRVSGGASAAGTGSTGAQTTPNEAINNMIRQALHR